MSTDIKEAEVVGDEPRQLVPRGDVDMLMTEAVRAGNLEVVERVMAIRRELKAEAAREAFYDAFAAFQAECPIIKKTKAVKSTSGSILYHYAPLEQIVKQAGPLISKHGFSYTFKAHAEEATEEHVMGRIVAICRVQHSAGHVEESLFKIDVREATSFTNSAQQAGVAMTYAKRYALCAAFGIVTAEDDTDGRISPADARKAQQPVSQPRETPTAQKASQKAKAGKQQGDKPQPSPAKEGEPTITAEMAEGIKKAMEHATLGASDFKARFPAIERLSELRMDDMSIVMNWIASPQKN